jgi:hypothetical protein
VFGLRLPLAVGISVAAALVLAIGALVAIGSTGGGGAQEAGVRIEPIVSSTNSPATVTPSTIVTQEPTHTPTLEPTATDIPAPTSTPEPAPTERPSANEPDPAAAAPVAPPVPEEPAAPQSVVGALAGMRVYANGDSTSYFMSVAVLQGVVVQGGIQTQPTAEYQISSGLWNTGYFDWYGYLASEMVLYDPDVVVFMVGANDAYAEPEGYQARVAQMMDQLSDRRLIWVGQPNMGPNRPDLTATLPGLNAVFQQEAAKRPWVRFVDAWTLTSDANGAYTPYLPDGLGNVVLARADDGVHFTPAGGQVLAQAVLEAIAGD